MKQELMNGIYSKFYFSNDGNAYPKDTYTIKNVFSVDGLRE